MAKLHRDNAGYIGCSHEETQDPYYSYNKLSLPLSGATETVQRPAEVTHTVTVAGGKFVIGGVSQATLSLIEGGVYKFDQSDSSNGTHPFKFSQTSNGTWNRGTEYTKGVSYVGTPGSSGAYTQLVVPFGGLDLYYYCGNHTGMGGSATTPANAGMFTAGLPILKTTDQFGKTLGSGTNADPFAANLVLAVTMNGADNSSTFTDISPSIRGTGSAKTITKVSYPYVSTAEYNLYGSSGVFDSDDYLTLPDGPDFDFGYEDFTIECWLKHSGATSNNGSLFATKLNALATTDFNSRLYASGQLDVYTSGSTEYISITGVPVDSWIHVAFSRKGNTMRVFVNGEVKATNNFWGLDLSGDRFLINKGRDGSANRHFQDVRVYKGVAKYQPEGSGSLGMDVVTYTGTGSTQSISSLAFQPDFVWIKPRSVANSHNIYDIVRGDNKRLVSNATSSEQTVGMEFESNGFTPTGSNDSGTTYVAWCWKAGGAAVSNTDGSITSQVSASTDYGFSVVSYVSNSSAVQTVGHGLSTAPKFIIWKDRDAATNWFVYHNAGTAYMFEGLNTNSAGSTTINNINNTLPSSSVFTLNSGGYTINANSNHNLIAYCWSEVAGFSKFGSYTGTGAAGNQTNVGFKPAFVLIKASDATDPWSIIDNQRPNQRLYADQNNADGSIDFEFTDTGFTINSTVGSINGSGTTYIYAAFAESAPGDPGPDAFKILSTLNTKDQSSSAHTITNKGASFQTSVKKFYDGAAEFNGSSSSLTIPGSAELAMGTGDFTYEMFIRQNNYATRSAFFDNRSNTSNTGITVGTEQTNGQIRVYMNASSGTDITVTGPTMPLNQWVHIAVCRNGGTVTLFVNGSPSASGTRTSDLNNPTHNIVFGYTPRPAGTSYSYLDGYMQDVRVYKGIAKYTSSFSPPERSIQGTARRYPSGVYVVS